MHPLIYRTFEEICQAEKAAGPVLEVGSVPGPDSLLRMKCLSRISGKTGINLDPPVTDEEIRIVQGNANEMTCFGDALFETVLCNATLEHDAFFWKTTAEIRRVTRPGGLVVIGVPGYSGMGIEESYPTGTFLRRVLRLLKRATRDDGLMAGTLTLGEHFYPGDYYRFSAQAIREVLLEGLVKVTVRKVMNPPRIIGWGRKSA